MLNSFTVPYFLKRQPTNTTYSVSQKKKWVKLYLPHTPAAKDLFWFGSLSYSGFKDGWKKIKFKNVPRHISVGL